MDELSWTGLVTLESRIDRAIVGALRVQDLSGFEIWRWLGSEVGTAGLFTEPNLYPTLYRLEAEGLLQSDWHEGEQTRRKYRLTARALELAEERNWPALAFRGDPTAAGAADRAGRRPASPDPEAGAWVMPPRKVTATTQLPAPSADRDWNRPPTTAEPMAGEGEADRPAWAVLGAFADDLGARLDLPRTERNRVRQEIADHLHDSARALEHDGYDSETAATEATNRLGKTPDLALLVELAQQSPERLKRGVRRGAIELLAEMALWLALSTAALVLAPGVTDIVTGLSRLAGVHVVVLRSAEWATNQVAAMLVVGAFAAGRMSLGRLTRISRHSDASLRRPWAFGGAAALLVVALLLPGYQDALTVATLLAVPVAFVAGTYRPQHVNEGAYSVRGVAATVLLVAAVTLLPCGRMFVYDPNATPGTPLAEGAAPVELTIYEFPVGTFSYSTGAGTVDVEVWPASTEGPFIVVDRSATGPTLAAAHVVDFSKLPPFRQWWIVAVLTAPDGQRTALGVVIQTGASPRPSSALGWLISKL
ncbi:MAG: helix-turn-helix transcriptional regulator [Candidatus Limnocylindrales bacterium]|jgi:DNA-binding PadR family transcriptional regulator